MKLDIGVLSYPGGAGRATTYVWICSYPGCGIERNFMEHPNGPPDSPDHLVPARVGSARWARGPEGWRRVHYMMDTTTGQRSIRVVCPDHAHIAGYGGLLDTPTLEAMMVLTVLLQG